jgi:hypothetical protein
VKEIIGCNDPESNQQKEIFCTIEDDKTLTRKGQLWLEVVWRNCEGWNTMEPFNRLKEDAPKLCAEFVRKEFGELPFKHKNSRALKNAIRWANDYLETQNEGLRAYIQRLSASGYYEDDENEARYCQHIEDDLKVGISVIREEANKQDSNNPEPEATEDIYDQEESINFSKMGVEDNKKVQYGVRIPQNPTEAQRFEIEDGLKWLSGAAKQECVYKLVDQFKCFGIGDEGAACPEGYQEIKLKIVYTNSPEKVIKARCCAVECGADSGSLNRYFSVVDLK